MLHAGVARTHERKSTMANSRGGPDECRVGILMGGLAGSSLEQHVSSARDALLSRGAAVFAVGEASESAALAALPAVLGSSLSSLGLVSSTSVLRPSYLPPSVAFASIQSPSRSTAARPDPHGTPTDTCAAKRRFRNSTDAL